MDESHDPVRPPKNAPNYLPRVWKAQPDPEPVVPAKKKKKKSDDDADDSANGRDASAKPPKGGKKSKDSKAKSASDPDKPKGALVEETPTFDTYQARQTARIIAGVAIAAVGLLFVLIIYWAVSSGSTDEKSVDDEALLAQKPSQDPAQAEREARFMFNRAREVVKRGNMGLTIKFLEKISRSYPQTSSARDAGAALSQPQNELAAFLEKATGVPTGPAPLPTVVTGPRPPPAAKAGAAGPAPVAPPKSDPNQSQVAANPGGPSPLPDGRVPLGSGPRPSVTSGPIPPMPATAAVGPSPPPTSTTLGPPSNELSSKTLPAGFHRGAGAGAGIGGWPLQIVCDRDGGTMLLVPGGNYRIGRDDGEMTEGPGHRVTLGTYYIDQHEVTVRQFDLFQKQDGVRSERVRALQKIQAAPDNSDDAPVTMVTARDAKDYATWSGKRLPTEAQWEIAARSGDGRLFPWGNDDAQWDKPREFRKVEPVQSHPRDVSPFGAFDMAGNAWEWTKDWYDIKYYNQFRNSTADNPTGPPKSKSEQLTVRGCSKSWAITKREGLKWNMRLPYLGFRCVLQVEGPGNALEAPSPAGGTASPGGAGNVPAVAPF